MEQKLAFGEKNYNYYSAFLRKKYQNKSVYKIIVDGGFSCPNRDGSKGYGGCSYCNVDSFTPNSRYLPSFKEQILHGMTRAEKYYKAEKFIVYFQPNTNTYAPIEELKKMYDEALSIHPEKIVGLSIGTRPDCLDNEKIDLLESYITKGFNVDLEIGMESIYDKTLEEINRGCSHHEFLEALKLLENSPIDLCIHTILGLPGETTEMMLKYADEINRLKQIKFIKLHHLHIVKGSIMGVNYQRKPFPLFTLESYTDFLCQFLPKLRPDVVIQRLFGLADLEMLIAPNWSVKKSEIQHYIDSTLMERGIIQGSDYKN